MGSKIALSLVAASAIVLVMAGCGGSSSSSTVPKVKVQKGPVFFATVQDANGQTATPDAKTVDAAGAAGGEAVYTFATAPVYPICAKGSEFSWIDTDESGDVNTGDTMLVQDFCTYSGTIINAYTDAAYRASSSATEFEAILAKMASDLGVSKADLLKAPSDMSGKVLATAQALYAQTLLDPAFNANNSNVAEATDFDTSLGSIITMNSNDSVVVEEAMFAVLRIGLKPTVDMAALDAKLAELNANNSNESSNTETDLSNALIANKTITFTDPEDTFMMHFSDSGVWEEMDESGTWEVVSANTFDIIDEDGTVTRITFTNGLTVGSTVTVVGHPDATIVAVQ